MKNNPAPKPNAVAEMPSALFMVSAATETLVRSR